MLGRAVLRGAASGLAGVAAMTLFEKVEQGFTHRPNSYVPGRTLLTMLGRRPAQSDKPLIANHAMHWGTGVLLGALRGLWAGSGLRGPRASLAHTVVRLSTDQTLENATGMGAPPSTWPRSEQAADVAAKAVYSIVTGAVADRLISPVTTARGRTSH